MDDPIWTALKSTHLLACGQLRLLAESAATDAAAREVFDEKARRLALLAATATALIERLERQITAGGAGNPRREPATESSGDAPSDVSSDSPRESPSTITVREAADRFARRIEEIGQRLDRR